MCCLRNIAMCDYQECVTTGQTDAGQSDPMCRYASQATQKGTGQNLKQHYECPLSNSATGL